MAVTAATSTAAASDLFVFTLLRHTTDGAWHRPAPESPRREDRAGWLVDRYFERRALYARR